MMRRVMAATLIPGMLHATPGTPTAVLPAPTGSYGVGVVSHTITDW